MKTSVILCTRNRLNDVLKFTGSLYIQTEPPSEYIIVDSSDHPLEKEEAFHSLIDESPFPVIYAHTSPGLTYQRNKGVKRATGDILFFFDDDMVLYPDYMQKINAVFSEHTEFMGGMGTFANMPAIFRTKLRVILGKVFMLSNTHDSGRFYPSGFPNHAHGKVSALIEVEVLSGGLSAYRRKIFDEFRFDEGLGNYSYMEDVDFSRRVSYKYRLFFNPKAKLDHTHVYGERPADDSRERRKEHLFNHRYLFFKNFFPRNKFYLLPHWWSIIGLFIHSFFKPKSWFLGYCDALREFRRDKKELSKRI